MFTFAVINTSYQETQNMQESLPYRENFSEPIFSFQIHEFSFLLVLHLNGFTMHIPNSMNQLLALACGIVPFRHN